MLNPFRNWVAGDAWEVPEADVGDIGGEAFSACCRSIAATVAERRTTAVLLRGVPGSGKTHLMRRLRAHLEHHEDPQFRDTLFVYVRLSTTAGMIWRHLRRRIADDLLRNAGDGSQLEWLLYRVLACPGSHGRLLDRCKQEWSAGVPWNDRAFADALGVMLGRLPDRQLAALNLYDHLQGEAGLPPALLHVLRRIAHRQDPSLARAWLRGDSLTAADLHTLGVPEDPEEDADAEYAAREMVLALARLAGILMPIVLCFDQVEALETTPGDLSGFLAFGGVASLLHDETNNLVLISCMQSSTEKMFRGADYDRIAEYEARLPLLGRRDAQRLIEARLRAAGSMDWPVPPGFDSVFNAEGLASARAILARAADLFDRKQSQTGGQASSVADFLRQEWERRVDAAAETIAQGDIDEVLDQGVPVLMAAARKGTTARERGDVHFVVDSGSGPVRVSMCNQRNMNSLAARLRRLSRAPNGQSEKLVLLRDPRLAISRTAYASRRYLGDLGSQGARLLRPSLEALQALEALRTLLADARSGDLTYAGEPVAPETVQDWIARNLPSSLDDLLHDIGAPNAGAAANPGLKEDLLALVEERCLVAAEEAARQLGQDVPVLRQMVSANPGLAGWLEGPPALLYRLVVAAGS
jgi:hypothetical protein